MLAFNIFFLLVVLVLVCPPTWECEDSQTRQGCRIQSGQCLCGVGCYSEYRYTTKDECWKALKEHTKGYRIRKLDEPEGRTTCYPATFTRPEVDVHNLVEETEVLCDGYQEKGSDLRRRYDVCQESPCLHGGTCSQTSFEPGYRCRCEGSGYYGDHCQNACPSSSNFNSSEPFPYECIVI